MSARCCQPSWPSLSRSHQRFDRPLVGLHPYRIGKQHSMVLQGGVLPLGADGGRSLAGLDGEGTHSSESETSGLLDRAHQLPEHHAQHPLDRLGSQVGPRRFAYLIVELLWCHHALSCLNLSR